MLLIGTIWMVEEVCYTKMPRMRLPGMTDIL